MFLVWFDQAFVLATENAIGNWAERLGRLERSLATTSAGVVGTAHRRPVELGSMNG